MDAIECCANCKFGRVYVEPRFRGPAAVYACHRHPPVAGPADCMGIRTPSECIRPLVYANDFCGEFRPRQSAVKGTPSSK